MEIRKIFVLIIIITSSIFIIGLGMNNIAVNTNGGRMPVSFKMYNFQTDNHFSYSDKGEVNFWYLSDIFPIKGYLFSIGDYLMTIGIVSLNVTTLFLIVYLLINDFKIRRKSKLIQTFIK